MWTDAAGRKIKHQNMKIFGAFARFFSTVMSPLLMPSYGVFLALWVSVMCYLPLGTRLMVTVVVFGITCILPMVFIALLHNAKIITDKRLVNPKERWLPYIFALACYVGAAFYLRHVHSPSWLEAFMWGGVAAVTVSAVVNICGKSVRMPQVCQGCWLCCLPYTISDWRHSGSWARYASPFCCVAVCALRDFCSIATTFGRCWQAW